VGLSEIVDDLANQQMQIQLAPQGTQSAAWPAIQNGFRNTTRPPKTGYDTAHCGDLDVPCRISHQVHITAG